MKNKLFDWDESGDVITGFKDAIVEIKCKPVRSAAPTTYTYNYDRTEYQREYYRKNREKLLKKANARYKPKKKKRRKNAGAKTNV